MTLLLASNPGLHSRFNKYLDFEDYGPDELMRIFRRFCSESQYSLDDAAASKLETLFDSGLPTTRCTFWKREACEERLRAGDNKHGHSHCESRED